MGSRIHIPALSLCRSVTLGETPASVSLCCPICKPGGDVSPSQACHGMKWNSVCAAARPLPSAYKCTFVFTHSFSRHWGRSLSARVQRQVTDHAVLARHPTDERERR